MERDMPTIKRLDSGYFHVCWSAEIWAQWPTQYWAPRDVDFFHECGTRERICEAAMMVTSLLRAEGRDAVEVYGEGA